MEKKHNWIKTVILILALLAVGALCFYFGQSIGQKTEAERSKAEREYSILLNRSELEGLGKIDGTIYITGHKSPDTDTVCSSIAYGALLQELGYDAIPVVLGSINHETEYILKTAGLITPELLLDASGLNMILMDHSEYTQSADGLKDARIISIIDHHSDGSVTTGDQLIYDARPLGSTATIVWIRYRNYGVEIKPQIAAVMLGAVLSDTKNLRSNTTTAADREAVRALSALAGIQDTDALYQEMYKASLSYEGMTDEEIFFSDYKEYESGGKRYSIGCIEVYDEKDAKDMAERMKAVVPQTLASTGMDMAFAQISIFNENVSITYLVPSDEAAAEVLDTAFHDQAVFDGTSFRMEPGISRKQVLVPAITHILEAFPQE